MRKTFKFFILTATLLGGLFQISFAQQTQIFKNPEDRLLFARDLIERKNFSAADHQLYLYLKEIPETRTAPEFDVYKAEAGFLRIRCAYAQNQGNLPSLVKDFLSQYSWSQYARAASFFQLRTHFDRKQWDSIKRISKSVYTGLLEAEEETSFHYFNAYADFQLKQYDNAEKEFESVLIQPFNFEESAHYHLAYLLLQKQAYSAAEPHLRAIQDSKTYGNSAQVWIAQSYFQQKNYDKTIAFSKPLAEKKDGKYYEHFALLTAQSYFMKGDYEKSVQFFKSSVSRQGKIQPLEWWQAGYAAWKGKKYEQACEWFSKIAMEEDSLGQSAAYYAGDCQLNRNNKTEALRLFEQASKKSYDVSIQELSLFNLAKIYYEIGLQPQALSTTQQFLNQFPKSKFANEARKMSSQLLLSSKNFSQALTLLDSIDDPGPEIKKLYHQIAFYHAVELYNEDKIKESANWFQIVSNNADEEGLRRHANFWLSEYYFRNQNIDSSLYFGNKFVSTPSPIQQAPIWVSNISAQYTIGYCLFKQKKYEDAVQAFEKAWTQYQESAVKLGTTPYFQLLIPDLLGRTADAYFILMDYKNAVLFYDRIINKSSPGTDYALYQKAIISGLQSERTRKLELLNRLVTLFPQSAYADNAYMDIANELVLEEKYKEALAQADKLIKTRPNSLLVRQASLLKGLIYYNLDQDDNAIRQYKSVAEQYPKTAESRDALAALKTLYISQNKVDEYFDYIKQFPQISFSNAEMDSTTWDAVVKVSNAGNKPKTVNELGKYLSKFPEGTFSLTAHFQRAELLLQLKDSLKAANDYRFIIDQTNRNEYTEKSLIQYAGIESNLGADSLSTLAYELLLGYTEEKNVQLLAYSQLMRSYFKMDKVQKAEIYAQKILTFDLATPEAKQEASLILGKIRFNNQDYANAVVEFTKTYEGNKNRLAAEAKYWIAFTQFTRKEYAASQSSIFELSNKIPYYDDWIAKGFILLAENYYAQKNIVQALATLKSIIDNHDGPELVKQAKDRYDQMKIESTTKSEKE